MKNVISFWLKYSLQILKQLKFYLIIFNKNEKSCFSSSTNLGAFLEYLSLWFLIFKLYINIWSVIHSHTSNKYTHKVMNIGTNCCIKHFVNIISMQTKFTDTFRSQENIFWTQLRKMHLKPSFLVVINFWLKRKNSKLFQFIWNPLYISPTNFSVKYL